MLNQSPRIPARPSGNRTSVMQIMYRMCVDTSRWPIDAIETPYNVPEKQKLNRGKELGDASHLRCRAVG
jgi:hypothetical protein